MNDEVVGATEAARILGVKGPNLGPLVEGLPRARLRSGSAWLRSHIEGVAEARRHREKYKPTGRVPKLVSSREAAEMLGVTSTYVRKVDGIPDPQELAMGPVWLEADIRRLARKRAKPKVPSCGKHGRRGMMAGPSGKEYCGICNRERRREWRLRNKAKEGSAT